jgi:hypothetical protein
MPGDRPISRSGVRPPSRLLELVLREVHPEEVDDAPPRVMGRGLVVVGVRELRDRPHPQGQLGGFVVVHEAVSGTGVDLDVVLDASPGERPARAGPERLASPASDYAADAAERSLRGEGYFGNTRSSMPSPPKLSKWII